MAFYVDNYLKDKKLAADAAIEAGNVVLAEGELVEFCSTSVPSFLRAGNLLTETENLLAGKFDNVGGYKITEPIIRELIAVNKIVEESFDNRLILCSKNKNDEKLSLKFSITFSNKGEKRACSLFLLEKIYNNSVFATLKSTLLATYTDANDANFETKCKKVFNYKTKQEGDGQEYMNEELVRLLIAQKLSLMFSWKNLEIGLESECEKYLQELIALLKKSGKYGEFVLARFLKAKSALGLSEKNIGKDYYKKLVDLMHKELLAAGGGKIPLSVKTKWLELLAKREEGIKTLIDFRPISKDPSKSTAKPASKSSGGGGSGGKKGGKKGGNKGGKNSGDNKKKDDKKKRAYGAPDTIKKTATDKRDKSKRTAAKSISADDASLTALGKLVSTLRSEIKAYSLLDKSASVLCSDIKDFSMLDKSASVLCSDFEDCLMLGKSASVLCDETKDFSMPDKGESWPLERIKASDDSRTEGSKSTPLKSGKAGLEM